jgi:hypothetical protein
MRWAGPIARMEKKCLRYVSEKEHRKRIEILEDLGVCGKVTLKWTLKKKPGWPSTGLIWLCIGQGAKVL